MYHSPAPVTYHAIVCHDLHGGIARQGQIPWQAPQDLQWFRQQTQGLTKAVVMGRKTWDSLPRRPLPGRFNLILTRQVDQVEWDEPQLTGRFPSIEALSFWITQRTELTEVYLIGGVTIYRELIDRWPVQHLWITQIMGDFNCDRRLDNADLQYDRYRLATSRMYRDGTYWFRRQHWVRQTLSASNLAEVAYLELLSRVKLTGKLTPDRTRVGTLSVFGTNLEFDLRQGFPLLTTKRVFFRGVAEELFWFLQGDTNVKHLQQKKVHIWDGNTTREYLDSIGHSHRQEGDAGKIYGFQWRHWGASYTDCHQDYSGQGYDQVQQIIKLIRQTPQSRRILMSAWNPGDLHEMALPPCHVLYQFYVQASGRLDCQMYQRSADLFLGVPFNIASTALLTTLVAKTCGLRPGKIRLVFGDAHLYLNHLSVVDQQLQRTPKGFPQLIVLRQRDHLEDYQWSDLELRGYRPDSALKAPMAT